MLYGFYDIGDQRPFYKAAQAYWAGRAAGLRGTLGNGGGGQGGSRHLEATSTLRDRTPLPQEDPLEEAEIIWGKPSNFTTGGRSAYIENGPYVNTTWTTGDPGGYEPPPTPDLSSITYEWTEIDRVERSVRINGPDGAYVDFMRVDEMTFSIPPTSDGRAQYVHMVFKQFSDG